MTFLKSIKTCLTDKYFTFSGRASRSEYWWFIFLIFLIFLPYNIVFMQNIEIYLSGQAPQSTLEDVTSFLSLLFVIPAVSVSARRLHDINRSGWRLFLFGIPLIGWILSLYWMTQKGTPGPNRFGEDPLEKDDNAPITERIPE
jgi:uncharacterized membrane protein YhaH (DUF805 family)